MKDFETALAYFSESNTQDKTTKFFEKYWLSSEQLHSVWDPIIINVFGLRSNAAPKNKIDFNDKFFVLQLIGGLTLIESELLKLQHCFKATGDTYFAVIEDYDENNPPHSAGPSLRFVFPSDVKWTELTGGGYISIELFGMSHKNYFILGNSGLWGKYAANDWKTPQEFFGFHPNLESIFRSQFLNK